MPLQLNQNPQERLSFHKVLLLSPIPLALGFGVYPALIPALLIAILGSFWTRPNFFLNNLQTTALKPGYLAFLSTFCLFFSSYIGFYIPYRPETLIMPSYYFWVLLALGMLTVLWVILFDDNNKLIEFIWMFCIGSLLFCVATVSFALWLQKPPFYGTIIDIRYLPLGIQKFINTPGVANLLCLFPMTFLAALLLKPDQRPRWFWKIGISGFVLSLISALTLGQRSYFVVVLFIMPLIVTCFLLLLKSWRILVSIVALFISYLFFRWLDQAMGTNLFIRQLDQNILNDPRFQMLDYWLQNIISNPFQRINVGPDPWSVYPWFHNFFADIHRLSGFWALLTALILVTYIFIRLIKLIQVNRRLGFFLMAIAIPCFLIMNTSVVPEAERQPFLLLLAIGSISEVILARRRGSN